MSETEPQIHGIISRQQMWEMWQPNGQRVELDGSFDPKTITSEEAVQIVHGSINRYKNRLHGFWRKPHDKSAEWLNNLRKKDLSVMPDTFFELLEVSHQMQQTYVERIREENGHNHLNFLNTVESGLDELRRQKNLSEKVVESLQGRLYDKTGKPFMQLTPVSRLEYARAIYNLDKEYPADTSGAACENKLGVIFVSRSLNKFERPYRRYTPLHETIHGLDGLEVYDITRADGNRLPDATTVGLFNYEPTLAVAGDDYTQVRDVEICEGYTDFITRLLMQAKPSLGSAGEYKGYKIWGENTQRLSADYPGVFRLLSHVSSVVEATPAEPDAKRIAIAEMHSYADRVMGEPNALTKYVTGDGPKLTEVHTRNT